jgi:hypothetical protein
MKAYNRNEGRERKAIHWIPCQWDFLGSYVFVVVLFVSLLSGDLQFISTRNFAKAGVISSEVSKLKILSEKKVENKTTDKTQSVTCFELTS